MRKVKYGKFLDHKPAQYDNYDFIMIGQHIAINNETRELKETQSKEYYIEENDLCPVIIKDPTILEKVVAKIKFIFKLNKNSVVGYRNNSESDLYKTEYQLGKKWDDEKQEWVIDEKYYENHNTTAEEVKEKRDSKEEFDKTLKVNPEEIENKQQNEEKTKIEKQDIEENEL